MYNDVPYIVCLQDKTLYSAAQRIFCTLKTKRTPLAFWEAPCVQHYMLVQSSLEAFEFTEDLLLLDLPRAGRVRLVL